MGYVLARQGPTGQQCHCYLPTTRVSVQKSVDRETDCNEAQSNIPKQFSTRFDAKFLRFFSQPIERNARSRCRLVLPDCSGILACFISHVSLLSRSAQPRDS